MKQIISHYQALPTPKSKILDIDKFMDPDILVGLVLDNAVFTDREVEMLNQDFEFIAPDIDVFTLDKEIPYGTICFSRDGDYFPTMDAEACGAIVGYRGKIFAVFYDTEYRLNVGHNGTLYCFSHENDVMDDADEIYQFIFEGLVPNKLEQPRIPQPEIQ